MGFSFDRIVEVIARWSSMNLGTRRNTSGSVASRPGGEVERRKLLATASMLSITAFATTVGLGANFGLFSVTEPVSPVGRLDARRTATAAERTQPPPPPSTTVPYRPDDD